MLRKARKIAETIFEFLTSFWSKLPPCYLAMKDGRKDIILSTLITKEKKIRSLTPFKISFLNFVSKLPVSVRYNNTACGNKWHRDLCSR